MSTTAVRPATDERLALDTVPKLLWHRAHEHPARIVFRHKELGIWNPITWATYLARTEAFALGLGTLGVEPGDRVAVHSENRPEWVYADVAIEACRAIVVGIYPTNPAAEVRYLLQNSGAKVLVAEDQEQVDKALEVFDECPDLERIVVIDPKGMRSYSHPALVSYDEIEARGRELAEADPDAFHRLVADTRAEDVAVLVYTSGTTGPPKGAMLTQQNGLVGTRAFAEGIGIRDDEQTVSYLPLCHLAERVWTLYAPLTYGVVANFAESIDSVQQDIYEIAPTFFGAVPRIAEKMQSGVEIRLMDSAWIKRKNYELWMRVGRKLARERLERRGHLSAPSRVLYALGNLFLYRALRERLGMKRVRHCLIGTAPVAPELMEYFHAIGIRMIQAYGQTECGGASHAHKGWDIRFDTVGVPFPAYECRLDPDTDEVLLRSEGNFAGYWNNPEATARTLVDGWLHTGDQGVIHDGEQLQIVGRIKDIIITAGGKNISPSEIENKLKFSPYVKEAVVIGEGRKYLTALIGIEFDNVAHWAERRGIPYTTYRDLSEREEVVELVSEWVQHVNDELARVENIRKFRLIPKELDHEDEELTATQKVKRSSIEKKFQELVETMYGSRPAPEAEAVR
ncbi:MAG: AMP-binding protein [Acidimicrobiia bacterium]|nr:AMP-binding protein [Acidimicrobiia bacterium]